MGTVLDLTQRLKPTDRARPKTPPCDVQALPVCPPTIGASPVAADGSEDGRVYLVVSLGGVTRRVPLEVDGAVRLARAVREAAEVASRRVGGVVLMRPTRRGVPRCAPQEHCVVVEVRGTAALLEHADTGERAWYSTVTGDPIQKGPRSPRLRITERDAAHLRAHPTNRRPTR